MHDSWDIEHHGNSDDECVWFGVGPTTWYFQDGGGGRRDGDPDGSLQNGCYNCWEGDAGDYVFWSRAGDIAHLTEDQYVDAMNDDPPHLPSGWDYIYDEDGIALEGQLRQAFTIPSLLWAEAFGEFNDFVGGVTWAAHYGGGPNPAPDSYIWPCPPCENHPSTPLRLFITKVGFDYHIRGLDRTPVQH